MKKSIIAIVIITIMVMAGFTGLAYYQPKTNSHNLVTPDSINTMPDITLYNTESFYGNYKGQNVFTGTVYYFYIPYGPGGETNPNYNWYVISVQIYRANDGVNLGGTSTCINLDSNNVWNVAYAPINKNPLSGGTVSVGITSSGPGVSVPLDYNGYSHGSSVGGNNGYCGGMVWNHETTIADQNSWNTLNGAYMGKVSASNSYAQVSGYTSISFYMWNTNGWEPWAGDSGWLSAQYDSGASCYVSYPNSV